MVDLDSRWAEAQMEVQRAFSLMEAASKDAEGAQMVLSHLEKARKLLDPIANPPKRLLPPRNISIRIGRYDAYPIDP